MVSFPPFQFDGESFVSASGALPSDDAESVASVAFSDGDLPLADAAFEAVCVGGIGLVLAAFHFALLWLLHIIETIARPMPYL
jgi:hypothetical protein